MPFISRKVMVILAFAAPVFGSTVPGINNFDKVDTHVYRGAQPTDDGLAYLAMLGVKTIVDLREGGGRADAEKRVVTANGMTYVSIPMTGLTPPTEAEMSKLMALMEDDKSGPVFVHCRRGADRTGAVIAAYHIDHDKWDNARALKDAKAHSMSMFEIPRQNFIRNFRATVVEASAASDAAGVKTN